MALGDAELTFLISSGIMLALFIIVYYKLYRKPDISRTHKVIYAIIFPGLVIFGGITIFIFQIFVNWEEVLMFNIIWIPLFLVMLQDLAGHPLMRKIPFGKLFIAAGLTILLVFCLIFVLIDILWFISVGEWINFLPLPILIILILLVPPLVVLTARIYGKGEEQFTEGTITSGGRQFLYLMVASFGFILIIMGSSPLVFGEGLWMPLHVGIVLMMIGIILLVVSVPYLIKERRKRNEAGYGYI